MKAGYSLIWSEGSLLTQQHFQYWELMLHKEQAMGLDLWHPHAYGIKTLVVDTVALTRGMCIIHKLVARHPSGEWFYYDHETMPPLSCAIHQQGECLIYLVVPNNAYCDNLDGYHVTAPNPGFAVEFRQFEDMHHPDKPHELGIKRRHMQISADHHETPATLSLVLMCLSYKGGKHYSLHEHFIPPSIICGVSAGIMRHRATVLQFITERSYQLNAYLATKKDAIAMQEALLLSEATHSLHQMQECMHPISLFDHCSRVIVNLGVLRGEMLSYQPYEHDNLMALFQAQITTLTRLLKGAEQTATYVPTLKQISRYEYEIYNIPEKYIQDCAWYLGVGYQEADITWVQRFTKQAKIASHAQWEAVLAAALPGVTLAHTQRTPSTMVLKSGYEYFKIIKQGDFWKGIAESRSFKMHMPHPFNDSQLTLDMVAQHENSL